MSLISLSSDCSQHGDHTFALIQGALFRAHLVVHDQSSSTSNGFTTIIDQSMPEFPSPLRQGIIMGFSQTHIPPAHSWEGVGNGRHVLLPRIIYFSTPVPGCRVHDALYNKAMCHSDNLCTWTITFDHTYDYTLNLHSSDHSSYVDYQNLTFRPDNTQTMTWA